MSKSEQAELIPVDHSIATATPAPTPINILEAAIRGGVTQENVSVVKELVQMVREQRAEEAKGAFAKAFFQMRKNMPEIYADKEAKTRSGDFVYSYCSEAEISKKLEPHLMSYGFSMLFGQTEHDGRITVEVTLMHEAGHSETRTFTVRSGSPNAMKDAASCDAGGATTAWRHLVIKLFGLKSRISDNQDARVEGEFISSDQVQWLREQVAEVGFNEATFLKLAGTDDYAKIGSGKYDVLCRAIEMKRNAPRK